MLRKLCVTFGLFAIALAGAVDYYFVSPTPAFSPPRIVSIRKGESLRRIARDLADNGIIKSPLPLLLWAKLSGEAARVQPGDYAFAGSEGVADVMRHLVNGDFMTVTVTIAEGLTVHQVALRLEQAGLVCDSQFEDAARHGALVEALGLGPLGAEGYLFPATYRFSPLATTDTILATTLARFYAILTPPVEEQMFRLGLDARELVTLASIIEKEAKVSGERALIAGVFYNRLRLKMPLQSDPTAQYSLDGEISRAATAVHTPSAFNTYMIPGLPPGPIANPGLSSIRAALYPVATDYLYFVARNDGRHVFSRSFVEHQRAIAAIVAANRDLEHQAGTPVRARTSGSQ
jgi:UPF0755 protein